MMVNSAFDYANDTHSLPNGNALIMNSANGRGIEMNDSSGEVGLERE